MEVSVLTEVSAGADSLPEPPQAVRDAVMDAARNRTISFFIIVFSFIFKIMGQDDLPSVPIITESGMERLHSGKTFFGKVFYL